MTTSRVASFDFPASGTGLFPIAAVLASAIVLPFALALARGEEVPPAASAQAPPLAVPETHAQAFERACGRGAPDACNALGVLYERGEGVAADGFTAVAFFENACAAGHAEACSNLGVMHERGKAVPQNLRAARTFYSRACDKGSGLGCSNLGALYFFGQGLPADTRRAEDLFQQACEAGSGQGCDNLDAMTR
jgi:TPR repeat protein